MWAGSELLVWGGCDPKVRDDCQPTADGFAFDPATRSWHPIPPAPVPGASARALWTGHVAIFLSLKRTHRLDGEAFDPWASTWRQIAPAPTSARRGGVQVWTGTELVVWGGGLASASVSSEGAAYDPAIDTWRRIADSPVGLNLASGLWTGSEVLVFGSMLDNRNHAATPVSVGAAYDPATDTWRELPASALSPQATSAVWVGGRMLAWDYDVHAQAYDPEQNAWSAPVKMPLHFDECYPNSVVAYGMAFAFFCGQSALYEPTTGAWKQVHGGPLDQEIWSDAYHSSIEVWRFADLVSSGEAVYFLGHGITLNAKGVACYGCAGSPVSFWAYRPPPEISPPAHQQEASRARAMALAQEFMYARILGVESKLQWLITPRAAATFGDPVEGVPEPLLAGTNYGIGGTREARRAGTFAVRVRLFVRGRLARELGRELRETLLIGPGRSLGGAQATLLVVRVRPGWA